MLRWLLSAPIAVAALLVGVYATGERRPAADLTYVNPSGIHTLDPARMSWTQDFRVAINIWEGLTATDPRTTEPIGGAAHFPPQALGDGLTYLFDIREDARWSNGDAVTAGDFVRGWRRSMEPGTGTDYVFLFGDHLAGAAEYIRWRQRGVATLTALSRARRGWEMSWEQARDVAADPAFLIARALAPDLPEPPDATDDLSAWRAFAAELHRAGIDWEPVYDWAFTRHVAELDRRFEAVGVKALDERTLEVRLARPCPYLLDLTAFPCFMPIHAGIELLRERHDGGPITEQGLVVYDPQWTKPDYHRHGYPGLVTNGPYRLAQWRFKRFARMDVNPFYRDAAEIPCRSVEMVVYDNISAALMAYEAGDVDFLPAMDVPYDHEIARLAASGLRPDFHLAQVLATYFFNFNCGSEQVRGRENPFVDAAVRRAFALAVDKRAIVEEVLRRGDRIAHSFVPPEGIAGYDPPRGVGLDVEEAQRMLGEAGFPGGEGLPPIDLLCVAADERVCQALARMWKENLGVRVELRSLEPKTFAEEKANQRFMIARGNWYADYYDPTTFLDCLISDNGNNDSAYASDEYDILMALAAATSDQEERMRVLAEAEAIIVREDLPILPILHYAQPLAIKPYVQGLYPNPRLRFPFRFVTIQR